MAASEKEYLDFLPLFAESGEDTVLARMIDWANEGLTPDSDRWVDTREGSLWRIAIIPCVREITRLIDMAGVDVPASASALRAWGPYLDEHAEVVGLARLAATPASGTVRFTAVVGTTIPAGTQVGVAPTSEGAPAPAFAVDTAGVVPAAMTAPTGVTATPSTGGGALAPGTVYYKITALNPYGETTGSAEVSAVIPATLAAPTGVTATPSATGGALAAGTYYYKVTALNAAGETTGSTEVSAVVPAGGTGSVALAWTAVPGATSYRIYKGTAAGGENVYFTSATNSYLATGGTGTSGTVPGSNTAAVSTGSVALAWTAVPGATSYNIYRGTSAGAENVYFTSATNSFLATGASGTSGTVPGANTSVGRWIDLTVDAVDAGVDGNVAAGAITELLTPLAGVTVSNLLPTAGGTEPEADFALRNRLLDAYKGQGAGNPGDYRRWARSRPGVGRVTVIPVWAGPGTVKVVITDPDGQPVSAAIVNDVQTFLDPTTGAAEGYAPIGIAVTVETPTLLDITITATIEPETGYSVLGGTGTTALNDTLRAAVDAYLKTVEPGDEVVRAQVTKALAVPGVHDIGSVTLSGAGANGNVAVPSNPARVPVSTTQTYTEGVL